MKKRVLSLFMALALSFSMTPTVAFAEEAGTVTEQEAQSGESIADVYSGGEDAIGNDSGDDTTAGNITGDVSGGDVSGGDAGQDAAVQAAQALIDAGVTMLDVPVSFTREKSTIWFVPEDLYTLNIPSARKAYQKQLDGLNALPTLTADQAALQRLAVYQLDRLDRIEAAMAEMTSKDMQVCVSGMPLTQEYITTAKQNADPKAVCAMNNVDLIVAGGYCGGQWRIPGVGALYVPELGWFPEDSQVQGLSFFGGIWQYVSPGLGKGLIYPWWMSFRLFNSPAVTTITLSKNIS